MLSRSLPLTTVISLLAFGSLCTLSACQSTASSSSAQKPLMTQLLVGEWTLSTMNGHDIASQITSRGKRPTLTFTADGKVSGTGGINRLSGSFDPSTTGTGSIKLDRMISTRMAGEPAAMQMEDRFLTALGKVDSFAFIPQSNGLVLRQGQDTLLTFTRSK